jgi:hypothetical protein
MMNAKSCAFAAPVFDAVVSATRDIDADASAQNQVRGHARNGAARTAAFWGRLRRIAIAQRFKATPSCRVAAASERRIGHRR